MPFCYCNKQIDVSFTCISLVLFYLSRLLFPGFLQFKRNFTRGENNSKLRD